MPDSTETIRIAQDIDKRLDIWSRNLSARWKYIVKSCSGRQHLVPDHTCNGNYHLYPDIWACNIWAYYRTARILLNLAIRDRLLPLLQTRPELESDIEAAKKNIHKFSTDILLSVPFSLSLRFSLPSLNEGHWRAWGCLGGYSILWPLYVAASVSASGSPHRKRAINRLEYIGHTMGIGQAFLMAKVVKNELPHECLSIYDYCRSYRPHLNMRGAEKKMIYAA